MPDDVSNTSEAQLRLQKLEQLVTSLIQTTRDVDDRTEKISHHAATVDQRLGDLSFQSSPEASKNSSGYLDIHESETHYLGVTHWKTILENVSQSSGRRCN